VTVALFFLFAGAALGGAIGVVVARNPVHSALFLVLSLVSVAVFFLLEDAQLVAAVQIIVYAGAIVVLFLFVIMLLGVDREESLADPVKLQRPAAIALGLVLLVEVLLLAGHQWATGAKTGHGVPLHSPHAQNDHLGNNIERVARVLFTDFLWPFQITAALLVIAVVGSIVLARRSGERPDEYAAVEASDRGAGTLRGSQRAGRQGEVERPGPQGQERER
jgi:NADH-quinone oxidoreductase subunit J